MLVQPASLLAADLRLSGPASLSLALSPLFALLACNFGALLEIL
jgi:hypothetical protein